MSDIYLTVAGFENGEYMVSDYAWGVIEKAKKRGLDLSAHEDAFPPRQLSHYDSRFVGTVRKYAKVLRDAGKTWPGWLSRVVVGREDFESESPDYVIFDGGHRARAAKVVGLPEVPVLIISYETYKWVYETERIERGTWVYILGAVDPLIRENLWKAEQAWKRLDIPE